MAEDLTGKVGTPFGPFPSELMATGNRKPRKAPQKAVPEEGIEPPTRRV
jgi:hypothetical protein